MNTIEIIFTVANVCLTSISVGCAIYSARQTHKQTDLMLRQIEISQQPDFALTGRLESIRNSIYQVSDSIKGLKE